MSKQNTHSGVRALTTVTCTTVVKLRFTLHARQCSMTSAGHHSGISHGQELDDIPTLYRDENDFLDPWAYLTSQAVRRLGTMHICKMILSMFISHHKRDILSRILEIDIDICIVENFSLEAFFH